MPIIVCQGYKKDGKYFPCDFMTVSNWNSIVLKNHQYFHTSLEDGKSYFWLGFGVRQNFEKLSGRDSKN